LAIETIRKTARGEKVNHRAVVEKLDAVRSEARLP
jgi:hypothetical protein